MPEPGDKRPCNYPGCRATMVLRRKSGDPGATIPGRVEPGMIYPRAQRLDVWVCEFNPREHVEVRTWGARPVKPCAFKDCKGPMVHSDKGRMLVPENIEKEPGRPYATIQYQAGWVCLEDAEHFEPGEKP
jgi:hypothetical protein